MGVSAPASFRPPSVLISAISPESLGAALRPIGGSTFASATWPEANLAIYVPFSLNAPITVVKMWCYNGASVSGNVDIGIYSEAWARLVSSGSTAQAGTSVLQVFDTTDIVLAPGRYYLALACDNTTATFTRSAPVAAFLAAHGAAQESSAFALKSTATPVISANAYLPLFGLSQRAVV